MAKANTPNVVLPTLNNSDVELWLAQIEYSFQAAKIKDQAAKFHYVAAALPSQLSSELRDILLCPPEENQYEVLREEIVKRLAITERERIAKLLKNETLGDRTPSQFLRYLQQLAGPKAIEETFLRQLFLQRLPDSVQVALASVSQDTELKALGECADAILEVQRKKGTTAPSCIMPITSPPQPAAESANAFVAERRAIRMEDLLQRAVSLLENLDRKFSRMEREDRARTRDRTPNRNHFAARPFLHKGSGLCYNHARYGREAWSCKKPCAWKSNEPSEKATEKGDSTSGN